MGLADAGEWSESIRLTIPSSVLLSNAGTLPLGGINGMEPTQEQIAEMDNHKLPCDVYIGHIRFCKGVSVGTLARAAARWREMADPKVIYDGPIGAFLDNDDKGN
jgi:hypothetical protein